MVELTWRDADVRRERVWLYAGELYAARIKALRPGQWYYALASPDILERNIGLFASADEAREAASKAVTKALNL